MRARSGRWDGEGRVLGPRGRVWKMNKIEGGELRVGVVGRDGARCRLEAPRVRVLRGGAGWASRLAKQASSFLQFWKR